MTMQNKTQQPKSETTPTRAGGMHQGMHWGVETWDSECGLGVPHWGEVAQGQADSVGSGGGPGVVPDTLE